MLCYTMTKERQKTKIRSRCVVVVSIMVWLQLPAVVLQNMHIIFTNFAPAFDVPALTLWFPAETELKA